MEDAVGDEFPSLEELERALDRYIRRKTMLIYGVEIAEQLLRLRKEGP